VDGLVVLEERVKLAAVGGEVLGEVKDGLEGLLDDLDALADGDLGGGVALLDVLRAGEVVGVGVGLEDVVEVEVLVVEEGDDGVGGLAPELGAGGLVVHDGVDDDGVSGLGVIDDVGEGEGAGVVEGLDVGGHRGRSVSGPGVVALASLRLGKAGCVPTLGRVSSGVMCKFCVWANMSLRSAWRASLGVEVEVRRRVFVSFFETCVSQV
jgi:hypothetical protein